MPVVKNLLVRAGADFSGMNKGMKTAQKSISDFGKSAKSINTGVKSAASSIGSFVKAGLAVAGVTSAVVALKESFTSFVALESSMMRVNFIFGKASENIQGFAETTASSLGMAESSAYNYAAVYGNLFRNITKDSTENSKVTIAMLQASAVVASKTGRTMDDVMERIRSGLMGNTEAIEDLGIYAQVGMLETTAAFKKIANGRSWEKLNFYEQQQIRTLGILEQAHKNFGDEVQQGSAYSLSTLSSSFKDLSSYGGQFVNAALQPIIKALTEIVKAATAGLKSLAALMGLKINTGDTSGIDAQTKAQTALTDEVEKTAKAQQKLAGIDDINTLSSGMAATSGSASGSADNSVFSGIASQEYEIKEPDTSWIVPVKNALSDLAGFIKTKFRPSINAWGKAFDKLKAPAIKAFDSMKGSLSNLWTNSIAPFGSYLITEWIPGIVNSFSETFAPIFSDVMPVAIDEWAKDFDFACQNISRITNDVVKPAFEQIKTTAGDVFSGIKKAWDEHGQGILDGVQGFKEKLREIWNSLYDSVFKPIFDKIGSTVSWLWDQHLKPLWDNITDFVGTFIEDLLTMWNNYLAPFVNWIARTFGPIISNIFNGIGDVIGTVAGVIADVVGGIIKSLGGVMDFITGVFTGNWKKAWSGIKDFFKGIWDSLVGIAKAPINFVVDIINSMIRGINNLKIDVPQWVTDTFGINDFGFNIPEIPKLAKGGIVDGPTLAMVGEAGKEAVMPLENNTGWMEQMASKINSFGSGDMTLTINNVLDDGTMVGRTTRHIARGGRFGLASALEG